MTVTEATALVIERRKQLESARAEANQWRKEVRVAKKLLSQAHDELGTALMRASPPMRWGKSDHPSDWIVP